MGKLGTSLSSGHVMVNGERTPVLLVGAPTHGRSRGQEPRRLGVHSAPDVLCRVESPALTMWFVPDAVSKMAFLTMTLHQGGATRMYRLSPAAQPTLLSTFSGDRRFSRFGGVLHLSDLDGDGLGSLLPSTAPPP